MGYSPAVHQTPDVPVDSPATQQIYCVQSCKQGPRPGERVSTLQSPDSEPFQNRIEELEHRIGQKEQEEHEAREEAAKLSVRIRRLDREGGGTSIDPHKAGKFWQQLALGMIKGSLQAINEKQRETARRDLYEAEAKMDHARLERRSLEVELEREREGVASDEKPGIRSPRPASPADETSPSHGP